MEQVFEQVLDALSPQRDEFFERLKEETRRKLHGGGNNVASDPVSEALVLDLAGNVLAHRLDREENDQTVEKLQLFLATIHKDKDRAIGRIKNMSRLDYSDLKTDVLSKIINDLLPSGHGEQADYMDEALNAAPSMYTRSTSRSQHPAFESFSLPASEHLSMRSRSSSMDDYASGSSARPVALSRRSSGEIFLRDDEIFRYADEEKVLNVYADNDSGSERRTRHSSDSRPASVLQVARERDVNVSMPIASEPRKQMSATVPRRGSEGSSVLSDRIRRMEEENQTLEARRVSTSSAHTSMRRPSPVSSVGSVHSSRHESELAHQRPVRVVPLSALSSQRARTPQPVRQQQQLRSSPIPQPPPPSSATAQSIFYEAERNQLLNELRRTRDEYNAMRASEEHIAAEIAAKVEEMQARIVEVQRVAQEATAAKDDEIARLNHLHEQEKAQLVAELEDARKITSETLEAELVKLKERFDAERQEWDQLRQETETIVRDTRTSLEERFEREKELAVRAATEIAAEMAADETRIQLEEFQSRAEDERRALEQEFEERLQWTVEAELQKQRLTLMDENENELRNAREQSLKELDNARHNLERELETLRAGHLRSLEERDHQHAMDKENLTVSHNAERDALRRELELVKAETNSLSTTIQSLTVDREKALAELQKAQELVRSTELAVNAARQAFTEEKSRMEQEFIQMIDQEKTEMMERLNAGWAARIIDETKALEADWRARLEAKDSELVGKMETLKAEFTTQKNREKQQLEAEMTTLKKEMDRRVEEAIQRQCEEFAREREASEMDLLNKLTEEKYAELAAVNAEWTKRIDELLGQKEAEIVKRISEEWASRVEEERTQAQAERAQMAEDFAKQMNEQRMSLETEWSTRSDQLNADWAKRLEELNGESAKKLEEWTKRLDQVNADWAKRLEEERGMVQTQFEAEIAQLRETLSQTSTEQVAQLQTQLAELTMELGRERLQMEEERAAWQEHAEQDKMQLNSEWQAFWQGEQERFHQERELLRVECDRLRDPSANVETLKVMEEEFALKTATMESEFQTRLKVVEETHVQQLEEAKLKLQTMEEAHRKQMQDLRESFVSSADMASKLKAVEESKEAELLSRLKTLEEAKDAELTSRLNALEEAKEAEFAARLKTLEHSSPDASVGSGESIEAILNQERAKWEAEGASRMQQSLQAAAENAALLAADVAKLEREELEERYQEELTKVILGRDEQASAFALEREEFQKEIAALAKAKKDSPTNSSSAAFEVTKLNAELRIAQEKARIAQEKLDLETRRIRNEYEAKLREQRHAPAPSVAKATDDEQEKVVQQMLQQQSATFQDQMRTALEEQNREWEKYMADENARIDQRIEMAVNAAKELAQDEVSMLKAEHEEELKRVTSATVSNPQNTVMNVGRSASEPISISAATISKEEYDQIAKIAQSLRRTMDTIIATLQDANRVSRASADDLGNCTPDKKINEVLRAAMRERAVFAKGILMSSKLASLGGMAVDRAGEGHHTPLTERKSVGGYDEQATTTSMLPSLLKGKENTSEAEELEALMMSEVDL